MQISPSTGMPGPFFFRPRVVIDTAGLTPAHTELANALAEKIGDLDEAAVRRVIEVLEKG